jgi:hypothetical protein
MPNANEDALCLRCNSPLAMEQHQYVVLKVNPDSYNDTIADLRRGRNINVMLCTNIECGYIELKSPTGRPEATAFQAGVPFS